MADPYTEVIDALKSRGIVAELHRPDQLVVRDPTGFGSPGWLTWHDGWYVCSWGLTCYRLPPDTDLLAFCHHLRNAPPGEGSQLAGEIVDRYRLEQVEYESLYWLHKGSAASDYLKNARAIYAKLAGIGVRVFRITTRSVEAPHSECWIHIDKTRDGFREDIRRYLASPHNAPEANPDYPPGRVSGYMTDLGYCEPEDVVADTWEGRIATYHAELVHDGWEEECPTEGFGHLAGNRRTDAMPPDDQFDYGAYWERSRAIHERMAAVGVRMFFVRLADVNADWWIHADKSRDGFRDDIRRFLDSHNNVSMTSKPTAAETLREVFFEHLKALGYVRLSDVAADTWQGRVTTHYAQLEHDGDEEECQVDGFGQSGWEAKD